MDRPACVDLRIDAARIYSDPVTVADRLRRFSPDVEPAREEPGVFWLSASGLERYHPSLEKWALAVRANLEETGFGASVVVGFTRFGAYALAKSGKGAALVLKSPDEEQDEVRKVPLRFLRLPPAALDGLAKLKKLTVGDLLDLPAGGLLERFGRDVHRLRITAAKDFWSPLQPEPPKEPICERIYFDDPESNAMRLTFFLKRMLRDLLKAAAARSDAITGLEIEISLDRNGSLAERIRPAAPTLDEVQLADLIRLRLESLRLPAGAIEILVTAITVAATAEQLNLFSQCPRRDLSAADRAFARLRAEFGDGAVTRAVLKEGHLPEACFAFEPMDRLPPPEVKPPPRPSPGGRSDFGGGRKTGMRGRVGGRGPESLEAAPAPVQADGTFRTLVRRIYSRPIPLQTRPVVGPRGCHLQGMGEAPATRTSGPYIVAGGWWARPVHREYHFAETESGRILWIYFDKKRRSWFLHGEVE